MQLLHEIADTLVSVATMRGDDTLAISARPDALGKLYSAGLGHSEIVGSEEGVRYAGATERMMRIAETAYDAGVAAGALHALTNLPDRRAALAFLEKFSTLNNQSAWFAVSMLGNDLRPEGKAIALRLFRLGRVKEPEAKRVLGGIAQHNGWR